MKPIHAMPMDADKQKYQVDYHPYDPRYPEVFARLRELIQAAAGPIRVEHVGSSSIPGVGGRRVIDLAIVAAEAEHAALRSAMRELGFEPAPFEHYLPLLIGGLAAFDQDYRILLYIVAPDAPVLGHWLRYRDYLRAHPDQAEAYGRVKREVLAAGHTQGESYQAAKTPFIVALNARIQAEANAESGENS